MSGDIPFLDICWKVVEHLEVSTARTVRKIQEGCRTLWNLVEGCGTFWKLMETHGNSWKLIEGHGRLWKGMESSSDILYLDSLSSI